MASKARSSKRSQDAKYREEGNPEADQVEQRVLMPRGYYDKRHPWFGSQIHYTIDVFRQLIRDSKARKQLRS